MPTRIEARGVACAGNAGAARRRRRSTCGAKATWCTSRPRCRRTTRDGHWGNNDYAYIDIGIDAAREPARRSHRFQRRRGCSRTSSPWHLQDSSGDLQISSIAGAVELDRQLRRSQHRAAPAACGCSDSSGDIEIDRRARRRRSAGRQLGRHAHHGRRRQREDRAGQLGRHPRRRREGKRRRELGQLGRHLRRRAWAATSP